jgi:hypothetical protein
MLRTRAALCVTPHKMRALCVGQVQTAAQCMLFLAEQLNVFYFTSKGGLCASAPGAYPKGEGLPGCSPPKPPKLKFRKIKIL